MNNYKNWRVDKISKADNDKVLSLRLISKEYENKELFIKWDGCVDLFKYDNGFTARDIYTAEKDDNTD